MCHWILEPRSKTIQLLCNVISYFPNVLCRLMFCYLLRDIVRVWYWCALVRRHVWPYWTARRIDHGCLSFASPWERPVMPLGCRRVVLRTPHQTHHFIGAFRFESGNGGIEVPWVTWTVFVSGKAYTSPRVPQWLGLDPSSLLSAPVVPL
jgi:hypothetical protein